MTASEHTELLPCPLCGGKAEVMFVTGMAYDWRARCTNPNCGANVRFTANSPSEDDPRRAAVIAAWNKRATHDLIHQAIDGYVTAMAQRQHGGVAQDKAFTAICEAMGRNPIAELSARR